ncbi:helix-turn-helix domain-containing protein [Paenibacillus radicis (ex Xue et al. 2023)]|uniref:helix-turn-helix domain-containing protein n=1 Tax=Paenibacillus radicis (ex Xue et al. 2023) TaxID=2972489 RepID=UPI003AF32C94
MGSNIRKLRKLNNLNQVEFSSYIGISQGNLSEIEQGNCKSISRYFIGYKKEI